MYNCEGDTSFVMKSSTSVSEKTKSQQQNECSKQQNDSRGGDNTAIQHGSLQGM